MMGLETRTEIDPVLLAAAFVVNFESILVKTATAETDNRH